MQLQEALFQPYWTPYHPDDPNGKPDVILKHVERIEKSHT